MFKLVEKMDKFYTFTIGANLFLLGMMATDLVYRITMNKEIESLTK